jgi:sodium transport system permease protein
MSAAEHETSPVKLAGATQKFSVARLWRLIQKEWAETLRDRRTLITLVLMPLLVYPLLSIIFRQFLFSSLGNQSAVVVIGVPDVGQQQRLLESLKLGHRWLLQQNQQPVAGIFRIEPPLVEEPALENIHFMVDAARHQLQEGRIDLFMRWSDNAEPESGWQLVYLENSATSNATRSFIERRLRAVNLILEMEANPKRHAAGIAVEHVPLRLETKPQNMLPTLVPLVLLLMTITGAVYPAIDVTAGERERGTLEALVAAPVSRIGLLVAKYVAVLSVALLTAVMNLFAMFFTIYSTGLSSVLFGPAGISFGLILQILGLLLLFASFFSAVLLAITSFARSFKEAQAYLIPLMLVTLGPGLLSLSPTLVLNEWLAVTPLINVVLLARDIFLGNMQPLLTLVVVLATLLYALLAIRIAASVFGSDAILYGSERSWSQLWSRSPRTAAAPSLGSACWALCMALGLQATLGIWLQRSSAELGPLRQITGAALATLLIFLGVPFLFALWENISHTTTFRNHQPRARYWFAAILLGVSAGILVLELTVVGTAWGWLKIGDALKQALEQKNAEFQTIPFGWIILWLAIVPALAEELFFRGFLLRALEAKLSQIYVVGITGVAFALFHVLSPGGLLIERLLPALLLGMVLGILAARSGSVWPGVLLHALNNGVLLALARYKDWLITQHWLPAETEHLPVVWWMSAGAVTMAGLSLLLFSSPTTSHARPTP